MPKASLSLLPLVDILFEQVGIDLVGPLEKRALGYHYILVMIEYAMQYPKAILLRMMNDPTIVNELMKIFAGSEYQGKY